MFGVLYFFLLVGWHGFPPLPPLGSPAAAEQNATIGANATDLANATDAVAAPDAEDTRIADADHLANICMQVLLTAALSSRTFPPSHATLAPTLFRPYP